MTIRRIHAVPKAKVFHEKLDWRVKPRIDTHNETAIESSRHSSTRRQVCFHHSINKKSTCILT